MIFNLILTNGPNLDFGFFGLNNYLFIGTFLSFLVTAFMYMFGQLMRKGEYVELSKVEIYNTIFNVILIVSFFVVVSAINTLIYSQSGNSLFQLALSRIYEIVFNVVYVTRYNIEWFSFMGGIIKDFHYSVGPATYEPFKGLDVILIPYGVVVSFMLETAFASLYIQGLLLMMLEKLLYIGFLPMGLTLRAFPKLRDVGNFLISIAFAFSLMYPFMFVVGLDHNLINDVKVALKPAGSTNVILSLLESALVYLLSVFSYTSVSDLVYNISIAIYAGVAVPSMALILTMGLANSIFRYLKEVTPG